MSKCLIPIFLSSLLWSAVTGIEGSENPLSWRAQTPTLLPYQYFVNAIYNPKLVLPYCVKRVIFI